MSSKGYGQIFALSTDFLLYPIGVKRFPLLKMQRETLRPFIGMAVSIISVVIGIIDVAVGSKGVAFRIIGVAIGVIGGIKLRLEFIP